MRYFFVSFTERCGEYEFVTNHVLKTVYKNEVAVLIKAIKSIYPECEYKNNKIIINDWDICITNWSATQITKAEYDVISKHITHI